MLRSIQCDLAYNNYKFGLGVQAGLTTPPLLPRADLVDHPPARALSYFSLWAILSWSASCRERSSIHHHGNLVCLIIFDTPRANSWSDCVGVVGSITDASVDHGGKGPGFVVDDLHARNSCERLLHSGLLRRPNEFLEILVGELEIAVSFVNAFFSLGTC